MNQLIEMGKNARKASLFLQTLSADRKNHFLRTLADTLEVSRSDIMRANSDDIAAASHLSPAMIDRLRLTDSRLDGIIRDVRHVAELSDPVGECFDEMAHPDGLSIHKVRTPLGVVAVIYEARPNVTIDSASLLVKSGNAAILRGGKETVQTNTALMKAVNSALDQEGFPRGCVQSILDPDRALVGELLQMDRYVDMLIPRGGAGLHEFCRKNSRIPVITGGIGVCHIYVDDEADLSKSIPVIINAKVQRPTVCNAMECLLVNRSIAEKFLPLVCAELYQNGVRIHGTAEVCEILSHSSVPQDAFSEAVDGDFDKEWLSLDLSVAIVEDMKEAIEHIREHSTGHSDSILTENEPHAKQFVASVNSAAVYVNCSTRFTDGSELGLGAEIAISTQSLHARGPMALKELTTYKWVISGRYNSRK